MKKTITQDYAAPEVRVVLIMSVSAISSSYEVNNESFTEDMEIEW